jgi:hypothetical protein
MPCDIKRFTTVGLKRCKLYGIYLHLSLLSQTALMANGNLTVGS